MKPSIYMYGVLAICLSLETRVGLVMGGLCVLLMFLFRFVEDTE